MRYPLGAVALLVTHAAAIWPLPSSASYGSTVLFIHDDVQFDYSGVNQVLHAHPVERPSAALLRSQSSYSSCTDGHGQPADLPPIVATAIDSTLETIFEHGLYPWSLRPRNTDFDPSTNATVIRKITLRQNSTDPEQVFRAKAGELDESYVLGITEAGEVTIEASTSVGLSYGLITFSQLFYQTKNGDHYLQVAPVQISDAPKFKHRGINLDLARSYYPVKAILRQIDGAAYSKLNRLHLHITDSQSWPLEVPSLPELSERGRYAEGKTYSPEVLKHIQEYGALRGVQVYLEIDMPGHTGIIALSYPDLIAAWNIQPRWDTYALQPPSGALKLNSPAVDKFREALLDDVLPRVEPYSAYWHFGGDEVVPATYLFEPSINSSDRTVIKPFMQRFVDGAHDQIRENNLTPIVWQEMLLEWNLTLGKDVVVQCWKDSASVLDAVQKGHPALVGDSNNWYLDCGYGQWLDFYPGTSSQQFYPYADYCSPRKNWRQIYAFDPLASIPADLTHLVLGGEVHLWAEQADETVVDGKIWPRAAAAAEVLWSGPKDELGQNRSQITASPRLAELRERLLAKGIMAEPIQIPYCTQNGTQCAL